MSTSTRVRDNLDTRPWTGPTRRYDILKEGTIMLVVIGLLTVGLAALFSSPDEPSLTFKGWAQSAPDDLYATAVAQLDGSSGTATYGPPYNNGSDGLTVGPIAMQKWMGVTHPVNAAEDFVITPLRSQVPTDAMTKALDQWDAATADQQTTWAGDYDTALTDPAGANGDATKVPPGDYGPVPTLAQGVVDMAASGAYDNALTAQGMFYQFDQTKQLLMMGDGGYMDDIATGLNIQGNTWGMMNETGSYPGQQWLWSYSVWYQLPVFNNDNPDNTFAQTLTDNADAIIFFIMMLVMIVFIFLPFVPGLRSIPRWIPVHRLVWRQYYAEYGRKA